MLANHFEVITTMYSVYVDQGMTYYEKKFETLAEAVEYYDDTASYWSSSFQEIRLIYLCDSTTRRFTIASHKGWRSLHC